MWPLLGPCLTKACQEQIPYRWLTGNIIPDHCAFARFRSRHEEAINKLFNQVLTLCHEVGLVRLGKVFLDGTKIMGNVTDPDSRIMKSKEGYLQGFNSQAVVTENQIIIAAKVTQDENDLHQLEPMLQEVKEKLKETGIEHTPGALAADAGYFHEDLNIQAIEEQGPELFIATANRFKEEQAAREEPPPQGRIPASASKKDRMTRKLRTKVGKAIYKLRCQTVEPVFGQIKAAMGFRQFLRRGLQAVQSEWSLICLCSNLLKLHRVSFG